MIPTTASYRGRLPLATLCPTHCSPWGYDCVPGTATGAVENNNDVAERNNQGCDVLRHALQQFRRHLVQQGLTLLPTLVFINGVVCHAHDLISQ